MGVFPSLPSFLLLSIIPGTFLCLATPIAVPLDFLQVPDLRFRLSFEHLRLTANKHGSVLMSLEPNSLPAPPISVSSCVPVPVNGTILQPGSRNLRVVFHSSCYGLC